MNINYNECFWGDSVLKKIEIVYDEIVITVFNDVSQKNIYIKCSQCAGITNFINWEETIIENIFYEEIPNQKHPFITTIKDLYGLYPYNEFKNIEGTFFELRVLLIDKLSFSVICKNVSLCD